MITRYNRFRSVIFSRHLLCYSIGYWVVQGTHRNSWRVKMLKWASPAPHLAVHDWGTPVTPVGTPEPLSDPLCNQLPEAALPGWTDRGRPRPRAEPERPGSHKNPPPPPRAQRWTGSRAHPAPSSRYRSEPTPKYVLSYHNNGCPYYCVQISSTV